MRSASPTAALRRAATLPARLLRTLRRRVTGRRRPEVWTFDDIENDELAG